MKGDVTLELTSADLAGALMALANRGIVLRDVVYTGELSCRLVIRRQELPLVEAIAGRRGDQLRQLARLGPYWGFRQLLRHRLLLAGLAILIALTAWIPTRVLFLQVEGNDALPARLILEKAEECGIAFGADRSLVRSEQMKNALLDALPQLQWAGINTQGCVATITVKERSAPETPRRFGTGHLVAIRDGIITQVTCAQGTALCRVGQAVRAGETLISGYLDCGGVILEQGAEGEVFGETKHAITVKTSGEMVSRGDEQATEVKFSLILGKFRINFYKDSGILDTTCVKMYEEYNLTLPGGFRLPVTWIREQWTYCDSTVEAFPETAAAGLLSEYAADYLETQMVAGQILERRETVQGHSLNAEYICLEMIGQIRYEEKLESYGENHGENSQRGTD